MIASNLQEFFLKLLIILQVIVQVVFARVISLELTTSHLNNVSSEQRLILNNVSYLLLQVGYAMTTFQSETNQPVIGFDMGGML